MAKGSTILQAIEAVGGELVTLCYHARFKPRATCRLCVVERNGKYLPACRTLVENNDDIKTDSAELDLFRKRDLQFLLNRHPNECMTCEVNSKCAFQDAVWQLNVHDLWKTKSLRGASEPLCTDHTSASITRDLSKW